MERGAEFSPGEAVATLICAPACCLIAGVFLATKDAIDWRLRAGRSVGKVLRAAFGMHVWSLLFWFVSLLLIGFPFAVCLGNLTWRK
jgi:hypothetical protein